MLRSNPKSFLNELFKADWDLFVEMTDVDEMVDLWTREINRCLDIVAPMKTRRVHKKRCNFPKEVQIQIKKRKELLKIQETNVQKGVVDLEAHSKLKKHNNYCNKLIKKAIKENAGTNITAESSTKDFWRSINDILRPDNPKKNTLKIEVENQIIDDPQVLAEEFNLSN